MIPVPAQRRPWLLLAPVAVFLGAFFILPLAEVAWLSVSDPSLSLENYRSFFANPHRLTVLANTFLTALLVTVCCLVMAYPLALVTTWLGGGWAALLLALVAMNFWTSFLVRTYAWMVILGNKGPVVAILSALGWDPPPAILFTRVSSTLAMIHILIPFMVMSIYAVMKKIDPGLMRAAKSLGATPFGAYREVFLPLSAPGVVNGCTLVFIVCLGFYVTPVLLGSPREQMIAGVIGTEIEEFLAFGEASAMAMVLLAVTLGLFWLYNRLVGLDKLWG